MTLKELLVKLEIPATREGKKAPRYLHLRRMGLEVAAESDDVVVYKNGIVACLGSREGCVFYIEEMDDLVFPSVDPSASGTIRYKALLDMDWVIALYTYAGFKEEKVSNRRYSRNNLSYEVFLESGGEPGITCCESDNICEKVYVEGLMGGVNEHQRDLLKRKFFDGYTNAEIAEQDGVRTEAVRNTVNRALKRISKELKNN